MEGSARPDVCPRAGDFAAGEDSGPCGRWGVPLRSNKRSGRPLHVGGEHYGTVWADGEGYCPRYHRFVSVGLSLFSTALSLNPFDLSSL